MKLRTPNIKQFILFYILFSILTLNIFATQYKTYNEVNTKESLPTSNTWIISTDDDAGTGGDAGDFYYNATEIIPGFYNASLHDDADIDFYTFYVRKGQIINITIQSYNLSMNFDMYLLSPEVVVLDSDLKDAGLSENIIRSTQNGGNFYAKIETAVSDNFGNYSLYLEILSQNDFNTNNDAGNVFNDPLSIQNGNSSGTLVKNSDTNDFYSISIQKGEILDIFMESTNTTNIDLSLYDVENNLLAESNRIIGFNESIIYSFSQEGIFIIHLALVEETSSKIIIPYNLTIISTIQNDANSNTDAGNNPEDAYLIIPLTNSRFVGKLVSFGDLADYYVFNIQEKNIIYTSLEVPDNANLDLFIYNVNLTKIYSSDNELLGATEYIQAESLLKGTYYIGIEWTNGEGIEADYVLNIGLLPAEPVSNPDNNLKELIPLIVASVFVPLLILIIIILIIYTFTDVRIPYITEFFDKHFRNDEGGESVKSLKYALRVRDNAIQELREDLIQKDSKRAKDLERIHRLEEDYKTMEKVQEKLKKENTTLKNRLENLEEVNNDLANIIDSMIRRQLSKSSKPSQKAKTSSITSLLWLSENRLVNYIQSIPLLNERYILDKSKNFILTRDYAREIVRQAYWKRVGAMHLKKIKQVKVSSLSEDTHIAVEDVKEILRELVKRKEIPAPIHMDRISLLLSISEELIAELADYAQTNAVISLKEISSSYDTSIESSKIIFEKISEDGYAKGEFLNSDKFVVYELFAQDIINEGSIYLDKFIEKYNFKKEDIEDVRILIEKLINKDFIEGEFLTENMFLCFNNLSDQLKQLMLENIKAIKEGDTRRAVFDLGSVVESIVKEQLILDIHEFDDIDKLPQYQSIIESKALGRIIGAADEANITIPGGIELKSLNRYWAQKIKHTKPGELLYIPTIQEAREFIYDANKALNKLLGSKIPTKWKIEIAEKLL